VDFEVNVDTPSGCKIGCIISMASNVLADARFKSGFYMFLLCEIWINIPELPFSKI
jgi:hypothetical protein